MSCSKLDGISEWIGSAWQGGPLGPKASAFDARNKKLVTRGGPCCGGGDVAIGDRGWGYHGDPIWG
jgi:hypothetical protein